MPSRIAILLPLAMVLLFGEHADAADPEPKKFVFVAVSPEVDGAYKKLGAEVGKFRRYPERDAVSDGDRVYFVSIYSKGILPAYQFVNMPTGNLPDAGIPFGLAFYYRGKPDDPVLPDLAELKNLTYLQFNSPKIKDSALSRLKGLKNLTHLDLGDTGITDAGMKQISAEQSLKFLRLCGTDIGDVGLKELKKLKSLTTLFLWQTKITDAGLKELTEFQSLATISLPSSTTDQGVKNLTGMKHLNHVRDGNRSFFDSVFYVSI